MKWEIKDLYEENKSYTITFVIVMALCLVGIWLVRDYYRNEPVYDDTDSTMADIENRMSSIEQRVNNLQDRITKAEKTVSGTIVTIRESRENAERIEAGIGSVEKRLDDAIQRSGRIQNLIGDIENANR